MVPGEEIGLRIDQTLVQDATGTLTVYGLPPRSPKSPRPPATLVAKLSVSRPQPSECTLTYVGELRYVPGE